MHSIWPHQLPILLTYRFMFHFPFERQLITTNILKFGFNRAIFTGLNTDSSQLTWFIQVFSKAKSTGILWCLQVLSAADEGPHHSCLWFSKTSLLGLGHTTELL